MAAVAMLSMNACNQDEEVLNNPEQKGEPVEFSFGINGASTKTTMADDYTTTFKSGDAVGIFQVSANSNTVVTNAKYVFDGTSWNAEGTTGIYAEDDVTYSYYAYYPYQEGVDNPANVSITVNGDQTQGFEINDALMANNTTVAAGATNVSLTFDHAFSLVQVNLSGSEATNSAAVTLKGVYPTAKINLTDKTVGAAEGEAIDVTMWAHTQNATTENGSYVYRAVVPAQTIEKGNALLEIAANKNYRFTWSEKLAYEEGKVRVINVALGKTPEQTTITIPASDVTINKWGNSEAPQGSGTAEEKGIIEKFGETLADVTGAPTDLSVDTWFGLKQSPSVAGDISYSLVEDVSTTWGKAATLSYTSTWDAEAAKVANNNSWYVGTLGYLHTSPINVNTTSIYKVTLKVKGNANGKKTTVNEEEKDAVSRLVFTCRNADNSASFGISTNQSFTATTVNKQPNTADVWEEYSFYINFSKKSSTVGTVPTTELGSGEKNEGKGWAEEVTAADYARFDLRVYTNDPATADVPSCTATISISDVVIEPYIAEEGQ